MAASESQSTRWGLGPRQVPLHVKHPLYSANITLNIFLHLQVNPRTRQFVVTTGFLSVGSITSEDSPTITRLTSMSHFNSDPVFNFLSLCCKGPGYASPQVIHATSLLAVCVLPLVSYMLNIRTTPLALLCFSCCIVQVSTFATQSCALCHASLA